MIIDKVNKCSDVDLKVLQGFMALRAASKDAIIPLRSRIIASINLEYKKVEVGVRV